MTLFDPTNVLPHLRALPCWQMQCPNPGNLMEIMAIMENSIRVMVTKHSRVLITITTSKPIHVTISIGIARF